MWFKKQKTFYTELVSPDEEVLAVSGIPVELQWAFRWIGNALSCGKVYKAANRAAGDQLNKQAAEIEGLTREVNGRREWEAKIKEQYDALAKQQAQDAHAAERLRVCFDSLGLLLEHRDAELDKLTDELAEANFDLDQDDELIDDMAEEIERLESELERITAAAPCTCKAKKGKAK